MAKVNVKNIRKNIVCHRRDIGLKMTLIEIVVLKAVNSNFLKVSCFVLSAIGPTYEM